ncbi:hypothetical protein GCM10007418_22360 [Halopseudomonas salina]|uniref:Uncharacterized protein n=1 Tax=Halopseudomonas salina TaxID=1323744 RepID=A0ABQ1PT18_9GAMM|nr:hypothetical protein GCM10007418_22360 [Halopseudomonas salina]
MNVLVYLDLFCNRRMGIDQDFLIVAAVFNDHIGGAGRHDRGKGARPRVGYVEVPNLVVMGQSRPYH